MRTVSPKKSSILIGKDDKPRYASQIRRSKTKCWDLSIMDQTLDKSESTHTKLNELEQSYLNQSHQFIEQFLQKPITPLQSRRKQSRIKPLTKNNEYNPQSRQNDRSLSNMNKSNKSFTPTPLRCGDLLPQWLVKRRDFVKLCYDEQVSQFLKIPKVCLKAHKTNTETNNIAAWISNHCNFAGFPASFYPQFSRLLQTQLVTDGKIVDKLGVRQFLYDGEIVKFSKIDYKSITHYSVGDLIIKEDLTVANVSKGQSILLCISNEQMDDIGRELKKQISDNLQQQLGCEKIFGQLSSFNLIQMVGGGQIECYFIGEGISILEDSLRILVAGKMQMQWCSEISKQNKWPIGKKEWEIKQVCKQVKHSSEFHPLQCIGLIQDISHYLLQVCENSIILSIPKQLLKEILTNSQYLQICENIKDSVIQVTSKQKLRKQYNDDVYRKKQQLNNALKMMMEDNSQQ